MVNEADHWHGDYEDGIKVAPTHDGLEVDRRHEGPEMTPMERHNTKSAKELAFGREEKETVTAEITPETGTSEDDSKDKAARKMCGLARKRFRIFFSSLAVLLLVVVLATVLAVTLEAHAGNDSASTTAFLAPASAIPSSTSIAPLPSGTFTASVETVNSNSSCLLDLAKTDIWSCNITTLEFHVNTKAVAFVGPGPAIHANTSSYGMQPITNVTSTFAEAVDVEHPDRGVARYLQTYYDAVFLLPAATSFSSKREIAVGDQPWMCHFNGTLLQAFFYATSVTSDSSNRYPDVLRVRQSRMVGGPAPYCARLQVLDDGSFGVVRDGNGPIHVTLAEAGSSSNSTTDGCVCDWTNQT